MYEIVSGGPGLPLLGTLDDGQAAMDIWMMGVPRIKPFVQILLLIGLLTGSMNAALFMLDRLKPEWFSAPEVGGGFVMEGLGRIQAAQAQRSRKGGGSHRLCAIVGQSSVRFGVSVAEMEEVTGDEWDYLFLSGAGRKLSNLLDTVEPLRKSWLKPDLILFGMHGSFLLEQNFDDLFEFLEGVDTTAESPTESPRHSSGFFEPLYWITTRRSDAAVGINLMTANLRIALTPLLAIPASTRVGAFLDEPVDTPFTLSMTGEDIAAMENERGAAWDRRFADFSKAGEEAQKFVDVIREFRSKGSRVLVVVMPETSILRRRSRPVGNPTLLDPIREAFSPPEVAILDLQDLLPDSAFSDDIHANPEGRVVLSRTMAGAIQEMFGEQREASQPVVSRSLLDGQTEAGGTVR